MNWILTALIGAFLGSIAWLLFYSFLCSPRSPKQMGRFTWIGFIPRWVQKSLPGQLQNRLLNLHLSETLCQVLQQPSTRVQVSDWLGNRVHDYITHTLPQKWPMLSMLIGEKTSDKVKTALREYLEENWNAQVEKLAAEELSNEKLVERIMALDLISNPAPITNSIIGWINQHFLRIWLSTAFISVLLALAGRWIFTLIPVN